MLVVRCIAKSFVSFLVVGTIITMVVPVSFADSPKKDAPRELFSMNRLKLILAHDGYPIVKTTEKNVFFKAEGWTYSLGASEKALYLMTVIPSFGNDFNKEVNKWNRDTPGFANAFIDNEGDIVFQMVIPLIYGIALTDEGVRNLISLFAMGKTLLLAKIMNKM
ncbi:MAG: hypothetical protein COZ49_01600 [Candidatus Yonathbacteria bacterium CG_4_10_14_3_um_filter_47_65]|uniref:Uncharacterized protein n=2 Tax=Parcubacteria group TaxID=1794811 RepID=A0A2M8D5R6_9BACT|nr:MAG: hypothetical protein AUJ44_02245 [Candidatus Nomurabacteria bacterium CG1_02_47_685]PIP03308.1 MAG: hypothetical protein COX54_04140 [Candidatus Yonathbacteria bacterium CG23_combo_of_CG06-09_8_20_14_all_46_18]PIQ32046.1 MAG: hypothetical protein COW61_02535 [Candidatus Yonathbacteria bacterium CG17_big_fil_post_rev_8_21_14_2_50_46_19]PIX56534.1 MAG: hypothetical protein COZ49_01600 [Candidatus Yonathbacteria bacterium CG_4_10_14_3_um_filter_47_65]PIY58038.1 MAG: hypothetical protein CO